MTAPGAPENTELSSSIAAAAARVPGLLVAFLFGSQLDRRTWAESDLDIGVRWQAGLSLEKRVAAERTFATLLAEQLGSLADRLDLVDLDRAASSVAFRAIRDGKCAWARGEAERVRAIVRVSRRYDDEAPLRRLQRDAARAAVRRMSEGAHGR
jgi:predicted nucleotidyltransferase